MKSHASMNRIYRLVFNAALGIWVAVAENARGKGKGGRAASAGPARVIAESKNPFALSLSKGFDKLSPNGFINKLCRINSLLAVLAVTGSAAYAADAGDATVRGGAGSVVTLGNTTSINQVSQRLAIDWTKLSTASGEALNFNQPNAQAIALNRITGSAPSSFMGSLTANGQVFILNPNGVLFGAGSQVNVGGLVASTLGMNPTDFMNGSTTFTKTTGTGSVVNQGSMTANNGGYLALLAPEVRNEGVMTATLGTALLAAGNKVTLNLNNGSLLSYSIDQGAINALAENKHLIKADGGQVLLSAKALDALTMATVNNTGVIEAKTIQNIAGRIMLMGDMEYGTVNVGGTLDASAPNGGDGGFIETSAAKVKVASGTTVTTKAQTGQAGTWLIDPTDFKIDSIANGGDITGADLSTALNNNNVTYSSAQGALGVNGDVLVNESVSWISSNNLSLTAHRNIDFSGGGALSGGTGSTVTLNAGDTTAAGSIIGHSTNTVVAAGTLVANAKTGIGSAGQALRTHVNQAVMTNSTGGGIYLVNTRDLGVAASSVQGDINISTEATGILAANLLTRNINGLDGLRTTGSGDITLVGSAGRSGVLAGAASVTSGTAVTSAGAITLLGGAGADGQDSASPAGGPGGNIFVNDAQLAAAGLITLAAGAGGAGVAVHGAAGGAGGNVNLAKSVTVNGDLRVRSGSGGNAFNDGRRLRDASSLMDGRAGIIRTGNLNLRTSGNLELNGSVVSPIGDLALQAGVRADGTVLPGKRLAITQDSRFFVREFDANFILTRTYTEVRPVAGQVDGGTGAVTLRAHDLTVDFDVATAGAVTLEALGGNVHLQSNVRSGGGAAGDMSVRSGTITSAGGILDAGSGTVRVQTARGIGNDGSELRTSAGQLRVENTTSGGIRVGNVGSATAAVTAQGDVSIRTVDYRADSLTVGSVEGLSGITSTQGSVTLSASAPFLAVGGDVIVNAAVTAQGDVTIRAGAGSGGQSESRGGATPDETIHGYRGGNIVIAAPIVAGGTINVAAGGGGNGGRQNTFLANQTGSRGGHGGDVILNSTLGGADAVRITAGSAGGGGELHLYNGRTYVLGGPSGNGGNGGSVVVNAAQTFNGDALLAVGAAAGPGAGTSIGTAGIVGVVTGTNVALQAARSLAVDGFVAPISGPVTLAAGTGITNGAGGAVVVDATLLMLHNTTSGDVLANNTGNITVTGNSNVGRMQLVSSTGDISLNGTVTATAANDAIRLAANKKFINNAGSGALTVANGSRWLVWSQTPVSNTFGGLQSGNAAVWGTAYNPAFTGSVNQFIFSDARPTSIGIVKANNATKTYGDTFTSFGYTAFAGDGGAAYGNAFTDVGSTFSLVGTPLVTAAAGAARTATRTGGNNGGAGYDIDVNLNGATAAGYTLQAAKGTLTVNARPVVLSGNRVYDGTTVVAASDVAVQNTVNGDAANLTLQGAGSVANKNAFNGKNLLLGSLALAGNAATNYTFVGGSRVMTITPANLSLSTSDVTKTYDGTLAAAGTAVAAGGTLFTGDTLSGGTFAFTDKNFGLGNKTVATSGVTVADGNSGNNYSVSYVNNTGSTINKASLTVTTNAVTKTYDGGLTALSTAVATGGTQLFGTDTVSGGTFAFTDKNFGLANKTVTTSGVTVSDGNGGGNYNVAYVNNTASTINKAALLVAANNDSRIVGSPAYSGGNGVTYAGLVGGDSAAATVTGVPSYSGTSQGQPRWATTSSRRAG